MKLHHTIFALLVCTQLGAAPRAQPSNDWPAWRGPHRTGVSTEQGLLNQWPADGPKLAWKTDALGVGFSTPSIAAGRLYVMGNRDGQELVMARNLKTKGKEIWATPIGPVRHEGSGYPGPRSTPTVDGDRIYAVGINGDVVCLSAKSGQILWRHDMVADFGGKIPHWGYSESVLIDGPWALCTPGGNDNTIVALNKMTGEKVWGAAMGDPAGYSSIITAELGGTKQYIQLTARAVIGVRAADGEFLWRYRAVSNRTANISTPVAVKDAIVAATGYGTGGGMVDIERDGDKFNANERFFMREMKNHHGGLIVVDGHLYGCDDPGILRCIDLSTGETKWSSRECGKCSITYADGMLYCRSERGPVSLVECTPREFVLRGQFEQADRSDAPSWPHLVVSGGRMYVRDQDVLLVYEVGN